MRRRREQSIEIQQMRYFEEQQQKVKKIKLMLNERERERFYWLIKVYLGVNHNRNETLEVICKHESKSNQIFFFLLHWEKLSDNIFRKNFVHLHANDNYVYKRKKNAMKLNENFLIINNKWKIFMKHWLIFQLTK